MWQGLRMLRRFVLLSLACAAPGHAQPPPDVSSVEIAKPATDAPAPILEDQAPSAEENAFTLFVRTLRDRALAAGVSAATFDRETADLTFNPRVVRLDRAQPGGGATSAPSPTLNFAPYRIAHVDAAHIAGGRRRYTALRPQLSAIEARTGVPEAVMLAIYGHETGYGSFSGNFDILRSFASLAFEGRRRELFASEFIDTLRLIDRGIPRERLKGSWAGATGYPQFLPSAYLRLGTDGDGDGKIDIWTDEADALASIGTYLRDAGWKPAVPWGVAVRVPGSFDRTAIAPLVVSPRCPRVHARLSRWRTVAEWKAMGITIAGYPAPADDEQATLVEPDGPDATGYLLTTNYRAILDYNCSNFYALSVGLLADEVVR